MKPITKEQMTEWLSMVDRLPQAGQIPLLRKKRWLEAVYQQDPEHMPEQISALHGFSEKEIGSLVMGRKGEIGRFGQPRSIVMHKLMMATPAPLPHSEVMNALGKDWVAERFLKAYSVQSHTGSVSEGGEVSHPDVPWLRASPDGIVGHASSDELFLVNYALPSESGMRSRRSRRGEINLDEACAITYQLIACVGSGIPVSNALLVSLDTKAADNDYLMVRELPFTAKIADEIIKAGNYYYQMILAGEIPAQIYPNTVTLDDEQLLTLLPEFTAASVLYQEARQRLAGVKDKIERELRGRKLSGRVEGQLADVGIRKVIDEMAVLREARRLDIDVEEYAVMNKRYDTKELISDLTARGESELDELYTMSHSVTLPRAKMGARVEVLDALKGEGAKQFSAVYQELHQKVVDTIDKTQHSITTHSAAPTKSNADNATPKSKSVASRHVLKLY